MIALHTADLHLQDDEGRCRLMADMQQPEVAGSELAAAVGAKWREQQKAEVDSEEDEEEVPEPFCSTQLNLRRELHAADTMRQEMTGELMQAQVSSAGKAAGMEEQAESRLEMMAREVARQEAQMGRGANVESGPYGSKARLLHQMEKARLGARWAGLHIGSRVKPLGGGHGTLGHAALGPVARRGVVRAVADLATRTPRGLPHLQFGHIRQ